MKLNKFNEIPEGFMNCEAENLDELLGGSSLITLEGESTETIFLSCLLHGNEKTSFIVVKEILADYQKRKLPKSLMIFIGNTKAANKDLRLIPTEVDYNRIWEDGDLAENKLALEVMEIASKRDLFVSLDIHNNTGKNPNYGCINYLDENFLKLASHFAETTVFFTEPSNAHSVAFGKLCPSMTIEAGLSESREGIDETKRVIEYLLSTEVLEWNEKRRPLDIFHTLARIRISEDAKIDFNFKPDSRVDFSFISDLENYNFKVLKKGTTIAYINTLDHLSVVDNNKQDITSEFFKQIGNELVTTRVIIPSMLTHVTYIIKEDCLGYIMEFMYPNQRDQA